MLKGFEIVDKVNNIYHFNYKLNDNLYVNYDNEEIFKSVDEKGNKIAVYGYCFDVRNPKSEIRETLSDLLKNLDDFYTNLKYLNGHFILIFNINGEWNLTTDAAGITPIYFDAESTVVSTEQSDEFSTLNGLSILDLQNFKLSRLDLATNKLSEERAERVILDLVINQHKYFEGKNITLNFRRNKMNKALISILKNRIVNQKLSLRETDEITIKVGKWIARDFGMSILEKNENVTTKYVSNTYLMDYNFFINKDMDIKKSEVENFKKNYDLNNQKLEDTVNIVYNLLNKLQYRKQNHSSLIYDAFNVIAIQEVIYNYKNSQSFDPLNRIIKIIHPTIDFYDFSSGETLMQKYNKARKLNLKLKKEMNIHKKNKVFLDTANVKGIKVSENLDGTVLVDGITFHPALQSISKNDIFEVSYNKTGQGMLLVESYFQNPKNAHRIKVNLNGEIFNIDEFLDGKFINVNSEVNIKLSYERDYDAVSWQKAGRITIKEME